MDAALGPKAPHLRVQIAAPFSLTTASSCSARPSSTPRSAPPHQEPAPGVPKIPPPGRALPRGTAALTPRRRKRERPDAPIPGTAGSKLTRRKRRQPGSRAGWVAEGGGSPRSARPGVPRGGSPASGEQAQGRGARGGTVCPPWDAHAASGACSWGRCPARCPAEQGQSRHASLRASVSPFPGFAVPLGHRVISACERRAAPCIPWLATLSPGV